VSFGKVEEDERMMGHLRESARLMAAMGDHAVEDLKTWYCHQQLEARCTMRLCCL
jgi:hypothetical protein